MLERIGDRRVAVDDRVEDRVEQAGAVVLHAVVLVLPAAMHFVERVGGLGAHRDDEVVAGEDRDFVKRQLVADAGHAVNDEKPRVVVGFDLRPLMREHGVLDRRGDGG